MFGAGILSHWYPSILLFSTWLLHNITSHIHKPDHWESSPTGDLLVAISPLDENPHCIRPLMVVISECPEKMFKCIENELRSSTFEAGIILLSHESPCKSSLSTTFYSCHLRMMKEIHHCLHREVNQYHNSNAPPPPVVYLRYVETSFNVPSGVLVLVSNYRGEGVLWH